MTDYDPLLGSTISHYRILERIGGGGMGVVYKAQDKRLDRYVALKFLPEDLSNNREAIERFRREAKAASALNHPNICKIHDIGEQNGKAFIVMVFLEGGALKQRIAGQPMDLAAILSIGIEITDALDVVCDKWKSLSPKRANAEIFQANLARSSHPHWIAISWVLSI